MRSCNCKSLRVTVGGVAVFLFIRCAESREVIKLHLRRVTPKEERQETGKQCSWCLKGNATIACEKGVVYPKHQFQPLQPAKSERLLTQDIENLHYLQMENATTERFQLYWKNNPIS